MTSLLAASMIDVFRIERMDVEPLVSFDEKEDEWRMFEDIVERCAVVIAAKITSKMWKVNIL